MGDCAVDDEFGDFPGAGGRGGGVCDADEEGDAGLLEGAGVVVGGGDVGEEELAEVGCGCGGGGGEFEGGAGGEEEGDAGGVDEGDEGEVGGGEAGG